MAGAPLEDTAPDPDGDTSTLSFCKNARHRFRIRWRCPKLEMPSLWSCVSVISAMICKTHRRAGGRDGECPAPGARTQTSIIPPHARLPRTQTGADEQAARGRLLARTAPEGEARQHAAVHLAVDVVLVYEPLVVLCPFDAKLAAARVVDEPHDIVHGPFILQEHAHTAPRRHAPARAVRGGAGSRTQRSVQGGRGARRRAWVRPATARRSRPELAQGCRRPHTRGGGGRTGGTNQRARPLRGSCVALVRVLLHRRGGACGAAAAPLPRCPAAPLPRCPAAPLPPGPAAPRPPPPRGRPGAAPPPPFAVSPLFGTTPYTD